MKSKRILTKANNGAFLYNGLNDHIQKKYRADTPFDSSFVPYVLMIVLACIDASVFLMQFEKISYDSPLALVVESLGLLFGFDVVPVYLGIHLKRLNQGLRKDRFMLALAVTAFALAILLNIIVRVPTIEESDSTEIALTIFGIFLPVITSLGSIYISYETYNPLKIKKRYLEEALGEKEDEIRRFQAILTEYEVEPEFDQHLIDDDEQKYRTMAKMERALIIHYCEYVREKLMEQLADPASTSALSEEDCAAILKRLDREVAALEPPDGSLAAASPKPTLVEGNPAA